MSADSPQNHPRFDLVHRMVLQGEPKERVMKRLEVNNVTDDDAEALHHAAMKDRVKIIRKGSFKKVWGGFGLFLLSAIVFTAFWHGLGYIQHLTIYLLGTLVGLGFILIGLGIHQYLSAWNREGSVADE